MGASEMFKIFGLYTSEITSRSNNICDMIRGIEEAIVNRQKAIKKNCNSTLHDNNWAENTKIFRDDETLS